MNDRKRMAASRRVVVSLETIEHADRMLDAAVDLAATMRAELHGLFVEDPGMIDVADLPFTRVVTARAQVRAFDRGPLETRTRRDNSAFKRAVATRARQAQLPWSFGKKRGVPLEEIKKAARQSDIVVFQNPATALTVRDVIASARTIAENVSGIVITPLGRSSNIGPVVALDNGDDASAHAVQFAREVAAASDRHLIILIVGDDPDDTRMIEARRDSHVHGQNDIDTLSISPSEGPQIAAILRELSPGFVVADMESFAVRDETCGCCIVRAAQSPVLLLNHRVEE